jgi:hypothetical protein
MALTQKRCQETGGNSEVIGMGVCFRNPVFESWF